jgi:preprotein translocase subunit YajC
MIISEVFAQAGAAGAAGGGDATMALLMQFAPLVLIAGVFYFLVIRPQQQQRKNLQDAVAALKKGDVIVTSGGLIGKVKSVAEDELRVELAPNIEVRLVRYAVGEVRSRTEPAAANDSKPASAS